MEEMLLRNGHEVVECLVGKAMVATGFFNRNVKAPVKRFIKPDSRKRASIGRSALYNAMKVREYLQKRVLQKRIKQLGQKSL